MKINRLEITGFGPFKDHQIIDFDQFDSDGLFLINGKTGSGKSSILDAICFALYAQIPRYVGSSHQVRSDHCQLGDPTEVVLEFTVDNERYQVKRSPEFERPKRHGEGKTVEKAKAGLSRWNGSTWEGIATQQREVNTNILAIVKLSRDQFLQVILLAQNRFHEFLFADSGERQKLLRTLFHTLRFDEYARGVKKKADELRAQLNLRNERAETFISMLQRKAEELHTEYENALKGVPEAGEELDLNWFDSVEFTGDQEQRATLMANAAQLKELRNRQQEQTEKNAATALQEFETLRKNQELYDKKIEASQRHKTLTDQRPGIEEKRQQVKTLESISHLESLLAQFDRQTLEVASLGDQHDAALRKWRENQGVDVHDWKELHKELTGLAAVISAHRQLDTHIPEVAHNVTEIKEKVETLAEQVTTSQEMAAQLPATIEQLQAEVLSLKALADAQVVREKALAELTHRYEIASTLPALKEHVDAKKASKDQAELHRLDASKQLTTLYEQKILGYASELAQELHEGEPCRVCGSRQHPHPAPAGDAPVSEEVIEAARSELTKAEEFTKEQETLLHAAISAFDTAQGKVGEASESELQANCELAQKEVMESQEALVLLNKRNAEIDQAVKDHQASNKRISELQTQHQKFESEHSLQVAELARITTLHEEHRGDFESISGRLLHVQEQLGTVEKIISSADELTQKKQALTSIQDALERGMKDSKMESLDHLRELIKQLPVLDDLLQQVTHFDDAFRDLNQILQSPEMLNAPTEPVDLSGAQATLQEAEMARTSAIANAERARGIEQEITGTSQQLTELERSTATELKQYEMTQGLADLLNGNASGFRRIRLENFVLAAELDVIVQAANLRLHTMSSGRYELVISDAHAHGSSTVGLGVAVFDLYTGRRRPTHSLSGGESFLASMALALGLAEVVTARSGGIKLDTLFIDEGFGSLDGETLSQALAVLDDLRDGGRTVGVISHVEAMKEQIPAQLTVASNSQGWGEITQ